MRMNTLAALAAFLLSGPVVATAAGEAVAVTREDIKLAEVKGELSMKGTLLPAPPPSVGAWSSVAIFLDGRAGTFRGTALVSKNCTGQFRFTAYATPDAMNAYKAHHPRSIGSPDVEEGVGTKLWDSLSVRPGEDVPFEVRVRGVKYLLLCVTAIGHETTGEQVGWKDLRWTGEGADPKAPVFGDPRIIVKPPPAPVAETSKPEPPAKKEPDKPGEVDVDGLVIFPHTLTAKRTLVGGQISGIIENRRGRRLNYVFIKFNLFDADGNQIGTAIDTISDLAAGGRWKFQAVSLQDFTTFKPTELIGR